MNRASAPTRIKRSETPWRELPYLSIAEVAEVLPLSLREVERMTSGENPALDVRRVGRRTLVLTSSVRAWCGESNEAELVRKPVSEDDAALARRMIEKVV